MDPRTQERVERWDSRPFDGGRDGLAALADQEFSGAVEAAGVWLFALNGRIVGVVDGTIEDAVDASGTIYDAPDPALPLLCAMEERGGETRARYYTNETPLSQVDRKLQQGSFTGYVELSEQVLSGDYYLVYYGGRRMAAAYIGNAKRLLTGEEAFERADDEVGIYEVKRVDIEVTDVPGRESGGSASRDTSGGQSGSTTPRANRGSPETDPATTSSNGSAGERPSTELTNDGSWPTDGSVGGVDVSVADAADSTSSGTGSATEGTDPAGGLDPDVVAEAAEELEDSDVPWATDEPQDDGESGERFKEEERWRETRRIPSIDPDSTTDEPTTGDDGRSSVAASVERSEESTDWDASDEATNADTVAGTDAGDRSTRQAGDTEERQGDLREKFRELKADRDRLRSENRELSTRVEELRAALERARAGEGGGEALARGTKLSPKQALAGTNLFVRYDSKSQPTLESAHGSDVGREAVAENLYLERHTQFDAKDAAVDGRPYEEYVEGTMEYQFVDWLASTLLYEIRDTGHADALADLYDVIPRIDRAELSASISLEEDDTEDVPDQVTFDVVAFDKRGSPLVVANLNDSREAATREMLESLEEDASAVNANYPDLGAAFVVTSSYFDPGALEIAEQATTAGFLTRGSKLSYVNLSRKQGYHLCLVESRSGGFHVTVPEL